MDEERLDIGGAIRYGWRTMVDNMLFFVVLALIFFVASGVFSGIGGALGRYPAITIICGLLGFFVGVYIHVATVYITLKVYKGEKPEFADIFGANRFYWRFLLADLLYGLIVMIGFILCIIPGIYLLIKYHFYGYIMIEQDAGVMDSLKLSWDITKGAWWDLFLLFILCWLIMLAGFILCGVGALFAWPIVIMAIVYAYKRIVDTAPRATTPVEMGPPPGMPPVPPA